MTRILRRSETGPTVVKKDEIEGKAVSVCRCGLSATQPFCDGSHAKTRDEAPGLLYEYARDGEGNLSRRVVQVEAVPEEAVRGP